MSKIAKLFIIPLLLISLHSIAQEINLDSLLEESTTNEQSAATQYTEGTFKTTRLIDGHTVETTQKGILDLKIAHRFGTLNQGFYNMFGLDVASMRIGVDYGVDNRFTIGLGRSTYQKQYDGFLKYKLLRQSSGSKNMPVTVTILASMMYVTDTVVNPWNVDRKIKTGDKLSYAYQVLIARKFSDALSLQLMPTLIHYNLVENSSIPNDLYSLGVGARIKLTQRSSVNIGYYYQLPGYKLPGTINTLSIGYEVETAGHVFQFHVSNSTGMTERTFITENKGRWDKGDIHLGFTISRVFNIRKNSR